MNIPEHILNRINKDARVVVSTGAGISAESGVPTFRGEKGLWKKYRPEELANFNAFISNPQLVWEWYSWRRNIISDVEPNPGHTAIAELEKIFKNFTLITQNVDGLHRRAGNKNIIEVHGNITRSYCIKCNKFYDDVKVDEEGKPMCQCGGLVRPDVVWFGEMLPADAIQKADKAVKECDLFFSVGTSAIIYPAAGFPYAAKTNGAVLIEINLEETPLTSNVDLFLQGKSGEVLPEFVSKIKELL